MNSTQRIAAQKSRWLRAARSPRGSALALIGAMFLAIGLYSGAATIITLAPFHRETVMVQQVTDTTNGVRLVGLDQSGRLVRIDGESDVAADYRVGRQLRVFVERDGQLTEDSGFLNLTGALVSLIAGGIALTWGVALHRHTLRDESTGDA